ncbi:hypothetical protein BC938DRAFT_476225 [Jimgerdemannia flammicorona]|uniref:Uncharacterized protein n=1 Tax=Jimgerdemannia flammicorona TaxID=994334 RepID=A0A433PJ88_9FUNG|nr:hypothetical protein BC938DRAFT_476225 [Jimgerdemannia flammicorona]
MRRRNYVRTSECRRGRRRRDNLLAVSYIEIQQVWKGDANCGLRSALRSNVGGRLTNLGDCKLEYCGLQSAVYHPTRPHEGYHMQYARASSTGL